MRDAASGISGGGEEDDARKVSPKDIQLVQNLIERCLQLYMNQKEVVETLSFQAKIEPSFTELVNQNACFIPDSTSTAMPDSFLHNGNSSGIINGAPATDQFIYAGKVLHGLPSGIDASASLLSAHSSTVGQFNGGNGTTIKAESSFSSNQEFAFGNDSTFLEPCQSIGDVSGGSFSSSELNGKPISDPILDMDISSYGFLDQIPRNFSFSDLTQTFSHSTEILENYGRSPFIPPENNFSESTAGDHTV